MSNQYQDFKVFQDSIQDSSWATISTSDDLENSQKPSEDGEDMSLDDTIPLDELDQVDMADEMIFAKTNDILQHKLVFTEQSPATPRDMKDFQPVCCSSSIHQVPARSNKEVGSFDFSPQFCSSKLENQKTQTNGVLHHGNVAAGDAFLQNKPSFKHPVIIREISKLHPYYMSSSPATPKDMKDFQPVYCSSLIHQEPAQSYKEVGSFDFNPQFCSSKLENQKIQSSDVVQHGNGTTGHTTPYIKPHIKNSTLNIHGISKLNPHLSSPYNARMVSEEFKPQKCSTALSESEFKINPSMTGRQENQSQFVPHHCSSGLRRSASLAAVKAEFDPPHDSYTGVQENSVAFIPLRCSTELNDSRTFNPPLSSTTAHVNDSNISDFKYLRLCSETQK